MWQIAEPKTEISVPVVSIVDDDISVCRSLSRLIRAAGWHAETFSSANEFVEHMPSPGVACVLLDIQMPGMTGPQLQEWMAGKDISLPVIFLTGHGDIPTSVQAMKRGAADFLLKPVDEEALLGAIRHAIVMHATEKSREKRLDEIRERYACLTAREREVIGQVIGGHLNKQIAADLGISEKTVKVHRARAMAKMGVRSVAVLVHACDTAGISQA